MSTSYLRFFSSLLVGNIIICSSIQWVQDHPVGSIVGPMQNGIVMHRSWVYLHEMMHLFVDFWHRFCLQNQKEILNVTNTSSSLVLGMLQRDEFQRICNMESIWLDWQFKIYHQNIITQYPHKNSVSPKSSQECARRLKNLETIEVHWDPDHHQRHNTTPPILAMMVWAPRQ